MHSAGQNIYRNISDALRRLRSDHEYFSFIPTHHRELEKKEKKRSVKVVTTIWFTTNFSITFHFYFLLRLFISNFKIIPGYHTSINLFTTSMTAESFVKPKKYIAGISDLAALAWHSLGSWFEKVFWYIGGISKLAALARQLNFSRFSPLV